MTFQRILITGGRDFTNRKMINHVLNTYTNRGDTLIVGGARGVDTIAEQFAFRKDRAVDRHMADWEKYGKRAGCIRNREMVQSGADLCIAFPGGRGTADCIKQARKAGIPVFEVPSDWTKDFAKTTRPMMRTTL